MAREIVTHLWCDACDARDEKTPGQPVQISLDGKKPVELDLCEVHDKELLASLRELMSEVGQPIEEQPPAAKVKPFSCPECGRGLSTRDSLKSHLKTKHDKDMTDPIVELAGVELPYPCPDCERKFETPQGRGAHRTQVHGYVSPRRVAQNAAPAKKTTSRKKASSQQESLVDA